MKKTIIFATFGAVFISVSAVSYAHKGATGIVKDRMAAMMIMGKVVKSVSSMMQGEIEIDPEQIRQGATIIESHAGESMTKLFPEGSMQKASVAKLEIWSDWEGFEDLAKQLSLYAVGLEAAAENGLMSNATKNPSMGKNTMMGGDSNMMMGGAAPMVTAEQLALMPVDSVFNLVTQTCSSCHTKFRVEKK